MNNLYHIFKLNQERNVGVINGSILSMGLLTNRGPPSWHPAGFSIKSACKAAAEYCQVIEKFGLKSNKFFSILGAIKFILLRKKIWISQKLLQTFLLLFLELIQL